MNTLQIQIPEGHEIDTEKSDLVSGIIAFKKKEIKSWRDKLGMLVSGYYITSVSRVQQTFSREYVSSNKNIFVTEKQALSALAMAQLSQIIANDPRFGGHVTDEEWKCGDETKYTIIRRGDRITSEYAFSFYEFLAFHTHEQRDLFLEENMDLIKQYFML